MSGSHQHGNLCSAIIRETFGEVAEKVAMNLFRCKAATLIQIAGRTGLSIKSVKKALKGLCNYNLIKFYQLPGSGPKSPVIYQLKIDQVIFVERYNRCLPLLAKTFGSEGDILLDELRKIGCETASGIVLQAASRLVKTQKATGLEHSTDAALITMWEKLELLVSDGFVYRARSRANSSKLQVPPKIQESDRYTLPDLNFPELSAKLESGDTDVMDQKDSSILWKIRPARVTQLLRNEMFAEALTHRFDVHAGNLVRVFLSLYPDSAPSSHLIQLCDAKARVRKDYPGTDLDSFFEDYVTILLEDSSNLLRQPEYAIGDQYLITLKAAVEELTWSAIEKLVEAQFGARGARVFRIVRLKKYADQEKIQEAVLIPAKDTKQITYRLMAHHLLNVKEMKLPGNSAGEATSRAGSTSYLFYIDLPQVVRMFLETCFIAQHSAIVRHHEVTTRHNYLLAKQQQMDAYLSVEPLPEQAEMIEDLLTPIEREELEKVQLWKYRLCHSEYDVDESMLLFQLFLDLSQKVVVEKT